MPLILKTHVVLLGVNCTPFIESQNHRMAWVEKDHSDHLVSTPCYVQGRQPPDQAAQRHIQPGLQCLQGWGIHSLLGQPVLVRHHPHTGTIQCSVVITQSAVFSPRKGQRGCTASEGAGLAVRCPVQHRMVKTNGSCISGVGCYMRYLIPLLPICWDLFKSRLP